MDTTHSRTSSVVFLVVWDGTEVASMFSAKAADAFVLSRPSTGPAAVDVYPVAAPTSFGYPSRSSR